MKRDESKTHDSVKRDKIALLGYSILLPQGVEDGGELVRLIRDKRQVQTDLVESGRLAIWEHDEEKDGNPWLIRCRRANVFPTMLLEFDSTLFNVSEKEAQFLHPLVVQGLEMVFKAMRHAGISLESLHKTRTGIFVACYINMSPLERSPDETALKGRLLSSLSDHISYFLGTHGPSMTTETACSSSLVALTLAVESLRNRTSDTAIVVCLNQANYQYDLTLQACGVVDENGACRPFDDASNGMMRCEGFGCMIMRRMDDAIEKGDQVIACIEHSVMGSAGATPQALRGSGRVYEAPNAAGMSSMIRLCIEQAGLQPNDIDYLEAHATGTIVGDLVELEAIKAVFQESRPASNPLRLASVKSNIGHAEISAGLFSIVKAAEMIHRGVFLPTCCVDVPRRDFDWKSSNISICM